MNTNRKRWMQTCRNADGASGYDDDGSVARGQSTEAINDDRRCRQRAVHAPIKVCAGTVPMNGDRDQRSSSIPSELKKLMIGV